MSPIWGDERNRRKTKAATIVRNQVRSEFIFVSSVCLCQSVFCPGVLTITAFYRHAQQNAFRRRDVHLQSRSFVRWNQSLRRPAILGVGVTRLSSAMNPKTASNPHHPTLLFANSNQFQTLLLNSVWLFPFLQVGNSNTQDCMELLPLLGTSPLRQ